MGIINGYPPYIIYWWLRDSKDRNLGISYVPSLVAAIFHKLWAPSIQRLRCYDN